MGYQAILDSEIQVGKPITQGLWQKVKDNDAFLYSYIGGLSLFNVLNGSFEIDSDNDNIPDNWTRNFYPGGSGGFETTDPAHGAKAYKFVHPGGAGNGGGELISDYIETSEYVLGSIIGLSWILKSSVAGIKNEVVVKFYDKAKVWLSDTTIYSSTNNPTSWNFQFAFFSVSTNAKYLKIKLVGGKQDTDVAGTTWWDNVSLC